MASQLCILINFNWYSSVISFLVIDNIINLYIINCRNKKGIVVVAPVLYYLIRNIHQLTAISVTEQNKF